MRAALKSRLAALEARLIEPTAIEPTKPRKSLLPHWLMEDLEKQGVRFDASGYPENLSMKSGPLNRSG